MAFNKFHAYFSRGSQFSSDFYVSLCLAVQLYAGLMLSEKYSVRFVGVTGPSMVPTLEHRDNLVMLDCFTVRFIRYPKKGEVVMCHNPYKPGHTIIKRVINTEGELAELYSQKEGRIVKVEVPQGHIWVEGDNKENSKDSRDFGPISLALVDGIVRYRVFPLNKINKL